MLCNKQPQRVEVWYWKRTDDDKTYGSIEKGSPTFISGDGHDEVYGLPSLEYPGMIKVCCQICDYVRGTKFIKRHFVHQIYLGHINNKLLLQDYQLN